MNGQMTAQSILELLADKHKNDVFVPECKAGSSWGSRRTPRLDAWVMKRSWSPWTAIGYEIKVTRSDFLRDDKWIHYLPLCHQFSFVCLRGLIDPKEIGDGVGLIWVTKNGKRLITKVKAPRRDIESPVQLLKYILMSRAEITRSTYGIKTRIQRLAEWRAWLEDKKKGNELGSTVARELAVRASRVAMREQRVEVEREKINEIGELLKLKIGVDLDRVNSWNREELIGDALSAVSLSLARKARGVAKELVAFADKVAEERQLLSAQKGLIGRLE